MRHLYCVLGLGLFAPSLLLRAQSPKKDDPFAPSGENAKVVVPPRPTHPPVQYLKRFKEPSLSNPDKEMQFPQIRLFIIPTFSKPVSIRAYRSKDGSHLRVVRFSGKGGYDWGAIENDKIQPLKKESWNTLIQAMGDPQVIRPLAGMTDAEIDMLEGLDGSSWLLEVREKEHYFYSELWSPRYIQQLRNEPGIEKQAKVPDLTEFIRCCELLIQSAGFEKEEIR